MFPSKANAAVGPILTSGVRARQPAGVKSLLFLALLSAPVFAQDLGGDLTLHRLLIEGEDWKPVVEGLVFADGPATDAKGDFYFSDLRGAGAGIYHVNAAG